VVAIDKKLSDGTLRSAWPKLEGDGEKEFQQPLLEKGRQEEIARAYKLVGRTYRSANPTAEWVYYQAANEKEPAGYRGYKPVADKVPNCYGMSAKDAVELLHQLGYRAVVTGYGRVVSQNPARGTVVKKGTRVVLSLK
jgi:hypothetical protein